ncbi:MAG: hypothetical protein JKX80_02270 [Candidatus Pacebacteria bacterium]|nr:hypothetical protein [Candidatus Paceibacterota bacterium]
MPPKNKLFKGPLATIVVLALFLGIATFLLQNSTQLEDTNLEESTSEEIVVRSDGNDFDGLAVFPTWSTVEPATFPIVIDGQARGTWYFEANFPIEVQLRDGVVLLLVLLKLKKIG